MAERSLNQFQYIYEKDTVTMFAMVGIEADSPGDTQLLGSSPYPGGGVISITRDGVAAINASYTGQVAGMSEDITLQAVTEGAAGNSILLTGNGVLTIADLITAWNGAHPSNQVELLDGDDSQVPDNLAAIQLAGGADETNVGQYTVLLKDIFYKPLSMSAQVIGFSTIDGAMPVLVTQVKMSSSTLQSAVRGGTAITILCLDAAGAGVDPNEDQGILLQLICRNSSLDAVTG